MKTDSHQCEKNLIIFKSEYNETLMEDLKYLANDMNNLFVHIASTFTLSIHESASK